MLIKNAEIYQRGLGDLRLVEGSIAEIGTLSPETDEPVIEQTGEPCFLASTITTSIFSATQLHWYQWIAAPLRQLMLLI